MPVSSTGTGSARGREPLEEPDHLASAEVAGLRRLLDRQAIVDGINAYCRWVDLNRPEEQVRVFTDDCRVSYGGDDRWIEGRQALQAVLAAALARYEATDHRVTNIEVTFESSDTATAHSSVQAWHRLPGDEPDFVLYGRYHDRWVRTAEGWRLRERRLTVAGTVGRGSDGFAPLGRHPGDGARTGRP